MGVPDLMASPVLVGRDEFLALARRRLDLAATGGGHLLLVSGEAGIGKTRLVSTIARRAETLGFRVVRAASFPDDAEASGGVLLDLAGQLRRSADPVLTGVGEVLAQRLAAAGQGVGDSHRQRRILVQELTDALLALPTERPALVAVEDLHWADQLSLDVLARYVSAVIGTLPTMVMCAYRSDELYPWTPLREWRSRLLTQRLAEEIRLPRLTLNETATVISSMRGGVAPARLVAEIHDRSDGIPLHVEELLAGSGEHGGDPGPDADVEDLRVPDTLADAVLVRAKALDGPAHDVGAAAAVIGRSFDFDLLTAVTQLPPETVDRCLRDLSSLHLVRAGTDAVTFDFRHALIRAALYADLSLPLRRRLHERVAVVAVERGYSAAFVSAHYDHAMLSAPAYQYASVAASEASAVSAHREALQLYRRALRNRPRDIGADEHATLLAQLAVEAAAVDDNTAADEAFEAAHALWAQAADRIAAAAVVPAHVAVRHLLGDGLEQRVRRLEGALASLHLLSGQVAAEQVRARLLSALSAAYMLDRRLDESIAYGEQSRDLSNRLCDTEARLNTAATLGSVLVFAGQQDGWTLLEEAVTAAVDGEQEAEAARSYRMIGSSASVLVEYPRAEHWLTRGIAYAENVDLWNHRSYMAAHLAHVHWACGDWRAAQDVADHAVADGHGGLTTLITAQYVLGYLALGRGEWARANELLGKALDLGRSMAELQRLSPPLWGLAETALLSGDLATAVELCERGYEASAEVGDAAYLFPFLVTGTRAHLAGQDLDGARQWFSRVETAVAARAIPGTLPAVVHARGLIELASGERQAAARSLAAARTSWVERERFWEGTWALLDQAACAAASRHPAEAMSLARSARDLAQLVDAAPIEAAADALLRVDDGREVSPWHPLSAREHSVAQLVAAGLTNREIAARLVLSPKTVSAHVEHILTKLGAARRAEIAAWVARIDG